jgi:hypothetical protein
MCCLEREYACSACNELLSEHAGPDAKCVFRAGNYDVRRYAPTPERLAEIKYILEWRKKYPVLYELKPDPATEAIFDDQA